MAAPTARIDKGTFTRYNASDEDNLQLETCDFKSTREETFYPSIVNGCDTLGDYGNPSAEWSFSGLVKNAAGFVTQHVGTAVSALNNFASTVAGCDPAVGVMIFKDPSHKWTAKKPRTLDFTVLWKPFIE